MTRTDNLLHFLRRRVGPASRSKLRTNARYLAGLMDGEGSFMIINRKNSLEFSPCIALTMTHEGTVDFAKDIFGVTKSIIEPKSKKHKVAYALRVTTQEDCFTICDILIGYAITKREPIRLLHEFIQLWTTLPPYGPKRKEMLQKIIELHLASKKANQRGRPPNYEAKRKRLQKLVERQP